HVGVDLPGARDPAQHRRRPVPLPIALEGEPAQRELAALPRLCALAAALGGLPLLDELIERLPRVRGGEDVARTSTGGRRNGREEGGGGHRRGGGRAPSPGGPAERIAPW